MLSLGLVAPSPLLNAIKKAFTTAVLLGLPALDSPAFAQMECSPLPPPAGPTLTVGPGQAGDLRQIVADAAPGTTIFLRDGYYAMDEGDYASRLVFSTPGLTLRSLSGNPSTVVLDGGYNTRELISVQASDVTIAQLTLKRAYDHPIHVSGTPGAPIHNVLIHRVDILDPGQQAIKVNANQDGYADYGTIECSRIELTPQGRGHIRDGCYTGGIDVHKARGWVVRRNVISGFWCQNGLSEHGIHFWSASRDTLIEENSIVNCARGIGLGLRSTGATRSYPDNPYPNAGYLGHIDGIVRNNAIAAFDPALFDSAFGFDVGIAMEQVRGARILHNTVGSTAAPYSSIEWRFENTSIELVNNLVTHNLRPRDSAQSSNVSNLEHAQADWFVDLARGDLHLSSLAGPTLNSGAPASMSEVRFDFDHQARDAKPDIGADELGTAAVFLDGFESGELDHWTR